MECNSLGQPTQSLPMPCGLFFQTQMSQAKNNWSKFRTDYNYYITFTATIVKLCVADGVTILLAKALTKYANQWLPNVVSLAPQGPLFSRIYSQAPNRFLTNFDNTWSKCSRRTDAAMYYLGPFNATLHCSRMCPWDHLVPNLQRLHQKPSSCRAATEFSTT